MTGYTSPLLLVPGDEVFIGPPMGGRWRTVDRVRPCLIPAHGPVCTVVEAWGWRNLPATHHGVHSYVWARPGVVEATS